MLSRLFLISFRIDRTIRGENKRIPPLNFMSIENTVPSGVRTQVLVDDNGTRVDNLSKPAILGGRCCPWHHAAHQAGGTPEGRNRTPTGPSDVFSASGIAVCQVHQRDASVVRANTSLTGHLIAMLSSIFAIFLPPVANNSLSPGILLPCCRPLVKKRWGPHREPPAPW